MDANAIEMIRQYSDVELPTGAGALLMIEVDGPLSGLDAAVAGIEQSAKVEGMLDFRIARNAGEIEALWRTRKALSPALRKVAPGKINEDVVVPVTELPALINGLDGLSRRHGIPIVNFGRVGNGNIHVNLLLDPAKPGQQEQAEECLGEVFDLVLGLKRNLVRRTWHWLGQAGLCRTGIGCRVHGFDAGHQAAIRSEWDIEQGQDVAG